MFEIKQHHITPYQTTWLAMQAFTQKRDKNTADQLWLVQHPSVFTQGVADSSHHLLKNPENISVIKSDRGGQITYHGLGQLVIYCLLDVRRLKLTVKQLVFAIESSIIKLLSQYHINATRLENAPGVYVNNAKIAALGLRIKNGCSYHGLSLNIDMDLTPFSYINPCGLSDISVTHMRAFSKQKLPIDDIGLQLCQQLKKNLYARN